LPKTLKGQIDLLVAGQRAENGVDGFSEKRLAKSLGLTQFGVNIVTLEPGAQTALRHWHEKEDEFVLVLAGTVALRDENGEHPLLPGGFVGFQAGVENGRHLMNRSMAPARLLVVGSRRPGDETIHYPDDPIGPIHK